MTRSIQNPPVSTCTDGATRRVGVEIELTDLTIPEISEIVCQCFGGEIHVTNEYLVEVKTKDGVFRIEADLQLLQKAGESLIATPNDGILHAATKTLAKFAETFAPFEVVAPPLPFTDLPRLDELVKRLYEKGAQGTRSSALSVLGLQLNPEIPIHDPKWLFDHIRAYSLLDPWLRERRGIDVTRRITSFVDPYPTAFREWLAHSSAPASMEELCTRYLEFNPTRNRSLDMLPYFKNQCRDIVEATLDDERIQARPTFHYRLPDSQIANADWSVSIEWEYWLVVERLASRPDTLKELEELFVQEQARWMSSDSEWIGHCNALLVRNQLAPRR